MNNAGQINIIKYYEEENSQSLPSIQTLTNVSESKSMVSLKIYDQAEQKGSNDCSK